MILFTLSGCAEYKYGFVDGVLLKDPVQAVVENASELKVILILFARYPIDMASELARSIFFAKLKGGQSKSVIPRTNRMHTSLTMAGPPFGPLPIQLATS